MPARAPFTLYVDRLRSEIVKVAVLIAITAVAFAGTRLLATRVIGVNLQDAAAWHVLGRQAMGSKDVDAAIEAFRHAVSKDRDNRVYSLALADALALDNQPVAAERVLLSLRLTAPEDPDINLNLARLAAGRGDVPMALRYYQSALYAPPTTQDGPRQIRLELTEFLLRNGENERALAELIAAVDDLGDEPTARVRVATLLLQAGDAARALEQFQHVLSLDESNTEAAAGAGTAAFRLGDYLAAAQYLRSGPDTPALVEMRTTAELVLSRDPLAARIRASERRRRLASNIGYVSMRIGECAAAQSPLGQDPGLPAVRKTLQTIETRLKRAPNDQDVIDDGIAAVDRAERFLGTRCGARTPLDRALVIIAERHGSGEA